MSPRCCGGFVGYAPHGADPVFMLASATTAEPEVSASRLVGQPVHPVVDDGSPSGSGRLRAVGTPILPSPNGENDAPVRRSTAVETADLLATCGAGARTVAFVRSRRSAETVATLTRNALKPIADLAEQVAAYRAGYLPHERRALEQASGGRAARVAATNALELGVDIAGLDAVLMAGWPGTRASLWQQAGRAGRAGQEALAVLVARDDPLDTYVVTHPTAVFGQSVEATVLDPDNPYVLAPPVCGGRRVAAVRRRCRTLRPVGAAGAGLAGAPPSAPPTGVRLVLDPPRLGYRPGRPPWHRWPTGPTARVSDRSAARHRGPGPGARHGP